MKQYYDDVLTKQEHRAPREQFRSNTDHVIPDGMIHDGAGGKQNKAPILGKVPGDLKLLRAGGERLCKEFQQGKCSRTVGKNNKGCQTRD